MQLENKIKKAEEILQSQNKFHINLSLKRIKLILAILNNPQNHYKIIHVAGTNGKGSTCKIVNDILIKHFKEKKKVGLFTSPHLFSYCERIKINNINIKEHVFDRLINEINNLALQHNLDLTEFELLSASAFYYFYIKKVDYVILEVGLGGKYDATNAVHPVLEIITTIDFDHIQQLGDTIEKIAIQKAGIIKENSKVIVSKNNLGFDVIKKTAALKNAEIIIPKKIEFFSKNKKNYILLNNQKTEFNLRGYHQKDNLSLALCAIENLGLDIKNETIIEALKKVKWNFRLEFREDKNILIDGAHNVSGIKVLKNYINENYINNKKIYIFGCLKTKDYKTMLSILTNDFNFSQDEFYFWEFDYPNSLKFNELDEKYKKYFKKINKKEAELLINTNKDLKVICGSLYMLGQLKDI